MKAIHCKYLAPTNTKGSRIKMQAPDNKALTVPFEYDDPHHAGVTLDTVKAYARIVMPYAPVDSLTGPHTLPDGSVCFTFAA